MQIKINDTTFQTLRVYTLAGFMSFFRSLSENTLASYRAALKDLNVFLKKACLTLRYIMGIVENFIDRNIWAKSKNKHKLQIRQIHNLLL